MLTERLVGDRLTQTNRQLAKGSVVSGAVLAALLIFLTRAELPRARPPLPRDLTAEIGQTLLTRFVLPFELLAVLFLAALLGALFFARRED